MILRRENKCQGDLLKHVRWHRKYLEDCEFTIDVLALLYYVVVDDWKLPVSLYFLYGTQPKFFLLLMDLLCWLETKV
jgi:hypothetical protein